MSISEVPVLEEVNFSVSFKGLLKLKLVDSDLAATADEWGSAEWGEAFYSTNNKGSADNE